MPVRRSPAATEQLRADLLRHARELVHRDGVPALTMRALAAEAGCAVGLIYKVFADRDELVLDLVALELRDLAVELEAWAASAGRATVAEQLDRFAAIMLESPTPALVHAERIETGDVASRITADAADVGFLHALDRAVAEYLAGEQRLGRVRADVDVEAIGFLVTGAVHNLVAAGPGYSRPERARLAAHLAELARLLA